MNPATLGDRAAVLFESVALLLLVAAVVYLFRRLQTVRNQRDQLRQEKEVIFGFMHDVGEVFAGGEAVASEALLTRVLFYALRTSKAATGAIYLTVISWNYVASGINLCCSGMFQALGNTLPALLSSVSRLATFVVPLVWLAGRPGVRLVDFWHLSVASTALQALAGQESALTPKLAKVALEACTACADACKPHVEHHAECKACYESCMECIKQCQAVV